ncbi:helix-turn-helix domain-containing protein [Streptomyces sp. A 4/2]|uniref:helix-turn-helix domain-containing protein n=1 Tax=Streptomyces sp. A 4/2 TaxID=2934314 RepID=UPI002023C0F0|nr:helix-turn-helix domain-containing protein [Streptomyces sp. A 4/2]
MRIHLSARTRAFTVLGNEVLRDRRLSFTARGILAYLLSLPDGAREDVRTLADRNPGLGRRGVANALDELVELGYYIRRTVKDAETGQVRTETYLFDAPQTADVPQAADAPLPAPTGTGTTGTGTAGTGAADGGKAGAFPSGVQNSGVQNSVVQNREEEPSLPAPVAASAGSPPESAEAVGRGAALLSRLARVEPKLALSAADVVALAPLVVPWLERGVPELEARSLLTDGLPPVVFTARGILADRLVRKLPAPRAHRDAAAPAPAPLECADCRDPLPRGQQGGICAGCTGAVRSAVSPAPPVSVAERVAALRATLRSRPAAARG